MRFLLCAWVLLWAVPVFGHDPFGYEGEGGWKSSDGSKGKLTFRYCDQGWISDYYEETSDSFVLDLEFDSRKNEKISTTLVFESGHFSDGANVLDAEGDDVIGTLSCTEKDVLNTTIFTCTSSFTDKKGRKITVAKTIDVDHDVHYFSGTITTANGTRLVWHSENLRNSPDGGRVHCSID